MVHALASCHSSPPSCSSKLPHTGTTACLSSHPPFPLRLPSSMSQDKGETTFPFRPFDSESRRRSACRTVRTFWWMCSGLVWRPVLRSRVSSCSQWDSRLTDLPSMPQNPPDCVRSPDDPLMTRLTIPALDETRDRLLLLHPSS